MSMYHDTLLSKFVQSNPKYRLLIQSYLHTRYTRAWYEKSSLYKWIARSLELIRYLELLVEMGLRRKVSVQARWRSIVFIEFIKYRAFLRQFVACVDLSAQSLLTSHSTQDYEETVDIPSHS